jgi:hypothetical protein
LLTNKKLDYLLIRLANMALARKKKAFKKGRERVRKKKKACARTRLFEDSSFFIFTVIFTYLLMARK